MDLERGVGVTDAFHRIRVLLVDDDPGIVGMLRLKLETSGYLVQEAYRGGEALSLIGRHRPDLVLLDISMPDMGGMEVLTRIRQQNLDIAVIMMTAFGSQEVAVEALRHSADDYMIKPFDMQELMFVVERTVNRLQKNRASAAARRQVETEIAQAATLQADLMPVSAPVLAGFELAARCIPAREVSGDFYDWHEPSQDVLCLTVGDVMGKGMSSALLMNAVRAALRTLSSQYPPDLAMNLAKRALADDFERCGMFMTVFHGQLEISSRRLTYVDAGHGHLFVRHLDGSKQELFPRCLPLGLSATEPYQHGTFTFERGDALVIYTDGLFESGAARSVGSADVLRVVDEATSASDTVERLIGLVTSAGLPLLDDVTVVVLRCS